MKSFLLLFALVVGALSAPADDTVSSGRISPRAGFEINTPDFSAWGEKAKEMVKKPNDVAKDSVTLVTDSVKMGSEIGEKAVSHGTNIATQSVGAATDLGKMGISMGANVADKAFGIVNKVGEMIPIAGTLVSGGADIGKSGVGKAKEISHSVLDSINKWVGSGLGWISDTAKKGNEMVASTADAVEERINSGIDKKADVVGNVVAAGLGMIPSVKVAGSVSMN